MVNAVCFFPGRQDHCKVLCLLPAFWRRLLNKQGPIRLQLNDGAVPTLKDAVQESQPQGVVN